MNLPSDFWKCICGGYSPLERTVCPACGHNRASRQIAEHEGCTDEERLHEEVEKLCRDRRWAYVHARMDKPTTTNLGVPDFIIFPPSPHVIILELKSRTGKQRPDQLAWQCVVENCGHVYHICRSMGDFYAILRDKNL